MNGSLTEARRYEFDCRGYLVIPGYLGADAVAEAVAAIDGRPGAGGGPAPLFPIMNLGGPFWDLLTRPLVMELCRWALGDWFRFDHAYGLSRPASGDPSSNLHAGPFANQGSFQYQWHAGRPRCGLLVFGYTLEDGGDPLRVVPGSHKSGFDMAGRDLSAAMAGGADRHDLVETVVTAPGDLLVFTEALIHGPGPKPDNGRRRLTLYYKYAPGHMAWRDYELIRDLVPLCRNDLERRLLRPPYVGRYLEDDRVMSADNRYREPTLG
jgi:hypothetical protein